MLSQLKSAWFRALDLKYNFLVFSFFKFCFQIELVPIHIDTLSAALAAMGMTQAAGVVIYAMGMEDAYAVALAIAALPPAIAATLAATIANRDASVGLCKLNP
jgi:hypothetical protein